MRERKSFPDTCKFEDCGRDAHSRGWCASHYQQWYRKLELIPIQPRTGRRARRVQTCQAIGMECVQPVLAKGMCAGHYRQYHKGQALKPIQHRRNP